MTDGKHWGTFPTSLGANNTPTKRGIKVIMEKGSDICMQRPGLQRVRRASTRSG